MKTPKCILMKTHESKMRAFIVNGPKPNETRGKVYEREGSDFVTRPSFQNLSLPVEYYLCNALFRLHN